MNPSSIRLVVDNQPGAHPPVPFNYRTRLCFSSPSGPALRESAPAHPLNKRHFCPNSPSIGFQNDAPQGLTEHEGVTSYGPNWWGRTRFSLWAISWIRVTSRITHGPVHSRPAPSA